MIRLIDVYLPFSSNVRLNLSINDTLYQLFNFDISQAIDTFKNRDKISGSQKKEN